VALQGFQRRGPPPIGVEPDADAQLQALEAEIVDRFGPMPELSRSGDDGNAACPLSAARHR
jgi:hypothetical protein